MSSHTSTGYLPRSLAATLVAFSIAIVTAGLAAAEQREVDSPEYKACIDKGMGSDGAKYENVIVVCCLEADGETLNDSNGEAFTCVTYDEVENSTQPPQPQPGATPPKVNNPGLAPPPTPTTTPLIAPAPAPGLGPR